jgi:hypothetical protein
MGATPILVQSRLRQRNVRDRAYAVAAASGSTIHAVDLDQGALDRIQDQYGGVAIHKILADLRAPASAFPQCKEFSW